MDSDFGQGSKGQIFEEKIDQSNIKQDCLGGNPKILIPADEQFYDTL